LDLDQEGLFYELINDQQSVRRKRAVREHPGEFAPTIRDELGDILRIDEICRELDDVRPGRVDRTERRLDIGEVLDACASKSPVPTMSPALLVATWPAMKTNSDARTRAI